MLKFNIKDNSILSTLSNLQEATDTLSTLLSEIDNLDNKGAEDISMLYIKRESLLNDFLNWCNSIPGKSYINSNQKEWKLNIEIMLSNDKKNIGCMELKLKELKKNIRKLDNQKSILIYSKVQL